MKGNNKNNDKKRNILSIKHIIKENNINEHIMKDKRYLTMAIALSNITHSIKHEEIQTCSSNIKILQKSLCKPVSVVLQRLSQETFIKEFKKYLYITKSQCKSKVMYQRRKRSKFRQFGSISRKFKEQKLQFNNDISNIFYINNKPENTSLNLTNNVYVDDELNNERKNSDQRLYKKEVLQNVQSVVMLSNQVILNQVDENKLKSKQKIQETLKCIFSPENIIDNNKCIQNSYAYDDKESNYSLSKTNDELPSIKEADKNEKCLDKRKYKRKYMSHEESNDIVNSIKNQRKRKKKTELHHKDLEQTIVLNHFKPTDNKVTMSNLHRHAPYSNITDSKVILTKLENMYDNKYIINWKKKRPQQFLLFQNLESIEEHKHFPINILPTKTKDNSHKDVTRDSETNMNTEIGLNSCILPSKYEQPKSPKVLLVKLEKLGLSLKEQNAVSKVEHSTAQYIDHPKINFFNHSSNVLAHNSEVSSTTNECISTIEALAQLNPFEKENNAMIKYLLSKHAKSNTSTIQLEQSSSSSPKRILQDLHNLENSSYISEKPNICTESTENMKYPEICTSSIYEVEETSNLSKPSQIIQNEIISPQMILLKTHLQRYLERVSRNSSLAEVNSITVSDDILKRNSKLNKTQLLPPLITEQSISQKKYNETLKLTSAIDYEDIIILQNNEKTLIDNDKQNALQKDTDQELSCIEDLPQFIIHKNSNINNLTNESIISALKETATQDIPVNNISISTESLLLYDIKNSIKDTDLLNKTSVNKDSRKIIFSGDIIKETGVSNINLPKSVQIEEINLLKSKITTSDNSFLYECVVCGSSFPKFKTLQSHLKKCLKKDTNSADDNNMIFNRSKDKDILETSECDDTPELNSQQQSSALGNSNTVLSKFLMFPSISSISKSKTKKINHENRQKDKRSRRKISQCGNKTTQCTVCLEVFDSMISLSKHIYGHTEKELQNAYEIAKKKQRWQNASGSDSERTDMNTTDSSQKAQISEFSSSMIESSQTDLENKKDKNTANKIISMEKMRQKENKLKEVENSLEPLTLETNEQVSMKISTVRETKSIKFCVCHKNQFKNKLSIELVLLCNICNILFQTRECFEAHFENAETYLCNAKRLTSRVPKLYCSVCQVVLYSFIGMREHMENHLRNFQRIKLFCHICKVRFIGMGPIFNLHWFNHTRNVCYVASVSNFPKKSIVDPSSEGWSIITSDQFKYLIVTEYVCSLCNAQYFSKNHLKNHMSSCTGSSVSKLSSIISANNHKNQDIQPESFVCNICNFTFSQKSLYEKHVASHENNLQPPCICLSMADIKKTYICNICANVYENLKEFMIHWQEHNAVRDNFTCNQCKKSFSSLETYIEHSQQCNTAIINADNTSCQVTYYKINFTCKICNLTCDSSKTLRQHTSIHNEMFLNLNTVHSNNTCNDLNAQKISLVYPTELKSNLIKPITIFTHSTDEITTNNSAALVNKSISEVPENQNSIINQSIDSLKLSTNSRSVESVQTVFDDVSLSDYRSTVDQNLENLSSVSDTKTDDSNATETNNFMRNNKSSVLMNKSEKKEETTAGNNNLNKYDNRKDLNNKNTMIVKSPDLKKKDVLDKNPLPSENIDINETQDDIILIEAKIPEENQNNSKESVKPMTSLQSNNSIETSEESVKTKKYLRVKNISELIDQNLKYNFDSKNDQDGNTNISTSSSIDLSSQEQTKGSKIEAHPIIKSFNAKQNPAKVYKMIIIDHSPTKKQAAYIPCYESEKLKECCTVPSISVQKKRATSISTPRSARRAMPIQSAQKTTPKLALQLAQKATPTPAPQSAQKETLTPTLQSAQRATPTPAPQSAQRETLTPTPQSSQRETLTPTSQSAQRETLTPTSQSAQRETLTPTPQSSQRETLTPTSQSAQRETLTPTPQSAQRETPTSQSAQRETPTPQSAQRETLTPTPTPQSAQKATPISTPQSEQIATSMPILKALLSAPPFTVSCTAQSQVSNVQYSSIKPFTTNSYPMNSRIITATTYAPSIIRQPQNMTQNQSILIDSSSSVSTNSSTNNYMNNTYIAQRNNALLSKTASTSMISNLQLTNNISNQNLKAGQPHDTHSTIKLQNAVHNTYSNRRAKVIPVKIRPRNSIQSYINNETSSLPVSSDRNHYYNNSNIKYPSINGGNLTVMQTQYSKQNNNRTNNVISMQELSNNLFQMSTFCKPVVTNSHSVMSPSLVHYQPSTSVASSQFVHSLYACRFCPKIIYFSTVQELDYHLNLHHNFFCNICKERFYSSNDLDIHKFKHNSLWF